MQRILLMLSLLLSANLVNANPRYLEVLDPVFYMNKHPDLKQAFGGNIEAAKNHWMNSGVHEGRDSAPWFSINGYCQRNPDLAAHTNNCRNKSATLLHYLNYGKAEGRPASAMDRNDHRHWALDEQFFLDNYADLKRHFGNDHGKALQHWLAHGIKEGRQGSYGFSPAAYLGHNPDLLAHFGLNYAAAVDHFRDHGRKEGRDFTPEARPDLKGRTIKMQGDGRIYIVDIYGRRGHITSPQASAKCKFDLGGTINMSQTEFLKIPDTSLIEGSEDCAVYGVQRARPEWVGRLVRVHNTAGVNVIGQHGKRWLITAPHFAAKCGLDLAGQQHILHQYEMDSIPGGGALDGNENCAMFPRAKPEWAGRIIVAHNDPRIFIIDSDGKHRYVTSPSAAQRCGIDLGAAERISMDEITSTHNGGVIDDNSDCSLFPKARPDLMGRMVRAENSGTIYAVSASGRKWGIASPGHVSRCGLSLEVVEVKPANEVNGILNGGVINGTEDCNLFPRAKPEWAGYVIAAQGGSKIYVVDKKGKKWYIEGPAAAQRCKFDLGKAVRLPSNEVAGMLNGSTVNMTTTCGLFPVARPEWAGRLISSANDPKVYVVDKNGIKWHIESPQAAAGCKLDLGKIQNVDPSDIFSTTGSKVMRGNEDCSQFSSGVDVVALMTKKVPKAAAFLNPLRGLMILEESSGPSLAKNEVFALEGTFKYQNIGGNNIYAKMLRGIARAGTSLMGLRDGAKLRAGLAFANNEWDLSLSIRVVDTFIVTPALVRTVKPQIALKDAYLVYHIKQPIGGGPSVSTEVNGNFFFKPTARDPWLALAPVIESAVDTSGDISVTFGGTLKGVCGDSVNTNTNPDSGCTQVWDVMKLNTVQSKGGVLKLTYDPAKNAITGIETALQEGSMGALKVDGALLTDVDASPGFGLVLEARNGKPDEFLDAMPFSKMTPFKEISSAMGANSALMNSATPVEKRKIIIAPYAMSVGHIDFKRPTFEFAYAYEAGGLTTRTAARLSANNIEKIITNGKPINQNADEVDIQFNMSTKLDNYDKDLKVKLDEIPGMKMFSSEVIKRFQLKSIDVTTKKISTQHYKGNVPIGQLKFNLMGKDYNEEIPLEALYDKKKFMQATGEAIALNFVDWGEMAMKAAGVAADEAKKVAAQVGKEFANGAKDLGEAMQKANASLTAAGETIKSGVFGAANGVSGAASKVGNAIKSIF